MKREIWQTEKDIEEERKLATILVEGTKYEWVKLENFGEIDVAIFDSKTKTIERYVEIKRRYIPSDKYDTYIIAASKIIFGQSTQFATLVPVLVAIQWDDAYGTMSVLEKPVRCFYGGRYDRPTDCKQREPMLEYKRDLFKMVKSPAT